MSNKFTLTIMNIVHVKLSLGVTVKRPIEHWRFKLKTPWRTTTEKFRQKVTELVNVADLRRCVCLIFNGLCAKLLYYKVLT